MADLPSPLPWPPDPRPPVPQPAPPPEASSVVVDCDGCAVRGLACDDCVVTVLLGPNVSPRRWDSDEMSALDALADAGLVPPLRLVEAVDAGGTPAQEGDINAPQGPGHTA